MIYFTSDLHLGHKNIIEYEDRPWETVEDMTIGLIKNWNEVVRPNDEVYILGDFAFQNSYMTPFLITDVLSRLNGKKHLIIGNHDTNTRINLYKENGLECLGYSTVLKYKKYNFYMSHYPTLTGNVDDSGLHHMTLNLFGHTHQNVNFYEDNFFMYHVGVDSHNCYPVSLDTVIEDIKNKYEECKDML